MLVISPTPLKGVTDGVGDTPYFIPLGNEDGFPLRQPCASPEGSSGGFVLFVVAGIAILGVVAITFLAVLSYKKRGSKP